MTLAITAMLSIDAEETARSALARGSMGNLPAGANMKFPYLALP
jgi:hypothetical protein